MTLTPLNVPAGGVPFSVTCQGFLIDLVATPLGVAMSNGVQLNIQ